MQDISINIKNITRQTNMMLILNSSTATTPLVSIGHMAMKFVDLTSILMLKMDDMRSITYDVV